MHGGLLRAQASARWSIAMVYATHMHAHNTAVASARCLARYAMVQGSIAAAFLFYPSDVTCCFWRSVRVSTGWDGIGGDRTSHSSSSFTLCRHFQTNPSPHS